MKNKQLCEMIHKQLKKKTLTQALEITRIIH